MAFCLVSDLIYPALTDVTAEALRSRGITFLMMDFDNTIVPYTTDVPTEKMRAWIEAMKASGIGLCVVSNSKKPRVVTFCKTYGLDCVTHAKKPFQKGHFAQCLARFRIRPDDRRARGGPDLHGCPRRELRGADVHSGLCN